MARSPRKREIAGSGMVVGVGVRGPWRAATDAGGVVC